MKGGQAGKRKEQRMNLEKAGWTGRLIVPAPRIPGHGRMDT